MILVDQAMPWFSHLWRSVRLELLPQPSSSGEGVREGTASAARHIQEHKEQIPASAPC